MMEAASGLAGSTAAGAGLVSVVIPALDESAAVPDLVAGLAAQACPSGSTEAVPFEVVLADGGSRDDTIARFKSAAAASLPAGSWSVALCPRRGRAPQMNHGAGLARGDVLLFLHADTTLPEGGLRALRRAVRGQVVGGGFRLAFRERDSRLRVIAAWASLRSRLTRLHYGDQGMFVRRDVFERAGGFPEVPLFEDRRLAVRLRREGEVVTLPLAVRTSGRRLLKDGVARTALLFAWLKLRHAGGADPADLARRYRDVR
jgi:rSAM/selenodomain-associated transferase 2